MTSIKSKRTVQKLRPGSALNPLPGAITSTATGCAILLLAASPGAYAQQVAAAATASAATTAESGGSEPALQEVVVTGIRKGIEDAISAKKNSDDIIESISAEDIGKLPDLSIADSIARLPGVSAQRDQYGNATVISIRGMGPDFVGSTLNGRPQTSTQDTRNVDYASYPAELISVVNVYKTPDPALVGQGLAGTVDIQTVKPLNYTSLQVAANARYEFLGRELPQTGHGDRFSFSVIDQFFDHTLGVAFGIARLDDYGGTSDDSGTWGGGTMQYQGATVNVPYSGLNENSDQAHQSRIGMVGVVQWKPNDFVESELDLFQSQYHIDDQLWYLQMNLTGATYTCYGYTGGLPCTPANEPTIGSPPFVVRQPQPVLTNAVLNGNNVVSGTIDGIRPVIQNIAIGSDQALHSLGWNTKFHVTDGLTLAADLNLNNARNQQYDIETYASTPTTLGLPGPQTTNISFNSSSLAIGSSLDFSNRQNTVFTDVLGWSCCQAEQPGYIKYPLISDNMTEGRLSGTQILPDNPWFRAVDFGADYSYRTKDNSTTEGYLWVAGSNGALYQNGAHIPGTTLQEAGESGLLIPTYNVYNQWSSYFQVGSRATPDILAKTWTVKEEMETYYGKLDIDSKLWTVPLHGNLGLQVVVAHQSSTAYATNQLSASQDVLYGSPELITEGTTTTEYLPSMNLIGDLGYGQKLRFFVGRQMARPNMADMNASTAVSVGQNPLPPHNNVLTGTGGNPYLKPFLADALDLSYEKYWQSKAYVSLAGFYKHLDSFIVTTTSDSYNFAGLVQPSYATNVSSLIGTFTSTVNGTGGYIEGVEFTASLPFDMLTDWLKGFGVVGNYSITNSSVTAPNTIANSGTTPLPGLSKEVGDLELYFERWGFEARVAERYRSQFIGSLITNFGIPGETYIKSEMPLDAQMSYEIQNGWFKGLQVQIQGQNLKNTPFRTYTTNTGAVTSYYFGQTFLFGLNYKY